MKPSDHNEFDERMKNAFDDFEMPVPERIWVGIEKDLSKKKGNVRIMWFARISAAAAIAMFIGLVSYYQFNNTDLQQTASNAEIPQKEAEVKQQKDVANNELLADVVEIKRSSNVAKSPKVAKKMTRMDAPKTASKMTQQEREAIDLLKKSEQSQAEVIPPSKGMVEEVPTKEIENANPSIGLAKASAEGKKKEVSGVSGILNYVSDKVLGEDLGGLVAVNETTEDDGRVRRKTEVDLGIVKFSRVRNGN